MNRRLLGLLAASLFFGAPAYAQLMDDFATPQAANCCLPATAKSLADQLQDWNQLGRYYAANVQLKKEPADPKRVVFMGDSITDGWRLPESFPGKPYVNRGISGQTTPQMLVRMYPDVIALKPAGVVILAGTNDIARNTGPETLEMIEQNFMGMTELAQKNGIKVFLCSVTPVSDYTMLPAGRGAPGAAPAKRIQTTGRPPADILKLNAWLKDYAAKVNAVYVDYFSVMVDPQGMLKDGFSGDGLHPNAKGYELMTPVIAAALDRAIK
jgi:lysophospholipase L1-like esterase